MGITWVFSHFCSEIHFPLSHRLNLELYPLACKNPVADGWGNRVFLVLKHMFESGFYICSYIGIFEYLYIKIKSLCKYFKALFSTYIIINGKMVLHTITYILPYHDRIRKRIAERMRTPSSRRFRPALRLATFQRHEGRREKRWRSTAVPTYILVTNIYARIFPGVGIWVRISAPRLQI